MYFALEHVKASDLLQQDVWCSGQTIVSGSQGAAIRPLVNGCGESEISPASGQPMIRLNGVTGSKPRSRHWPEGCNGRAPASPLPSGVA